MYPHEPKHIDWRRSVKFYPVKTDFLIEVARDLNTCFTSFGTAWAKIPEASIYPILKSSLKLYYFANYSSLFLDVNRPRPTDAELTILYGIFRMPRFIRDMCREYCRPMIYGNDFYLPDIRFEPRVDNDITQIFEKVDVNALNLWSLAWRHLGVELVDLFPESVKPAPLCFYHPPSNQIYSTDWLEDWRLEALCHLKHLEWINPEQFISSPEELNPLEMYESIISGRKAGTVTCLCFSALNPVRCFNFINDRTRFPSDVDHSRTPPKSSRVRPPRGKDLDKEIGPLPKRPA